MSAYLPMTVDQPKSSIRELFKPIENKITIGGIAAVAAGVIALALFPKFPMLALGFSATLIAAGSFFIFAPAIKERFFPGRDDFRPLLSGSRSALQVYDD